MFKFQTVLRLGDTDAAGRLYFTEQMRLAHEAFEELMERSGVGFHWILTEADFVLPIVHAEADYSAPIAVGDLLTFDVWMDRFGESSFTWCYRVVNQHGIEVGTGKTVHVCVDKRSGQKKAQIPEKLFNALKQISRPR